MPSPPLSKARRGHPIWASIGTRGLVLLLLAWGVASYLSFSQALFNDGDTSWHLAAGRLILAKFTIPHTDPFSFTFYGQPWTAHEWLSEVILAGVYSLGSWAAVAVLIGMAVAALILILGLEIGRWLPPRHMAVVLLAVIILLTPSILARPHVLAWPFLAAWTLILLRAREAERSPRLISALLMMLWANLHGSFVLGLLLIGIFGLEALLESKNPWADLKRWSTFGVASLLAAVATPHGVNGLLFPLTVSAMQSLPLIAEWRAMNIREDWLSLAIIAAVLLLLLYRRAKLSLPRVLLVVGLIYLTVSHVRHLPILTIIGTLAIAKPIGETLGRREDSAENAKPLLLALLMGMLILTSVRMAIPFERTDSATYPFDAIRHVPSELRARPVLNSYSFGGPLILEGIRPFIDGRADLYGDAFMFNHKAIVEGDKHAFEAARRKWDIGWTMLAPREGLVRVLDQEPGWRRIYADRWAVVHRAEEQSTR